MLDINISTILLQMANFFIMAFILYRFLFKPLQNTLKAREEKTTQMMDEAAQARQEAEEQRQAYEEKSNNIDAEIAARRNEARIIIEQTRQQMLQEVQSEVERLKHQTKENLSKLRADALREHREDIGLQASRFAHGILADLMTPQLQDAYQVAFLEQIEGTDLSAHIETPAPGKADFIDVILPKDPSPEYQEDLSRLLHQKIGQACTLNVEVNPDLIAGGILRFEDILIDGSLQGQIEQLKKKYQQTA
jgi:F-type H+-transporting ATPase subunit b